MSLKDRKHNPKPYGELDLNDSGRRLLVYYPYNVGLNSSGPPPTPEPTPTQTVTPTQTSTQTPTPTSTLTPTPTPSMLITFYLQTAESEDLQTAGGDNLLWTV